MCRHQVDDSSLARPLEADSSLVQPPKTSQKDAESSKSETSSNLNSAAAKEGKNRAAEDGSRRSKTNPQRDLDQGSETTSQQPLGPGSKTSPQQSAVEKEKNLDGWEIALKEEEQLQKELQVGYLKLHLDLESLLDYLGTQYTRGGYYML